MREKRIKYKTRGTRAPMIRGTKVKDKALTEEEKKLSLELMKLENRLARIKSKETVLGIKVNPQLKKRLQERIKVLKAQLNIPEKE